VLRYFTEDDSEWQELDQPVARHGFPCNYLNHLIETGFGLTQLHSIHCRPMGEPETTLVRIVITNVFAERGSEIAC
jgi:hypothetical protein